MININSKPALTNSKAQSLTSRCCKSCYYLPDTKYDGKNDPVTMNLPSINVKSIKHSTKSLREQINVVAEYHAHKIPAQRIAYRTGIEPGLVNQLINGENHQRLFKMLLTRHNKTRRDQRLKKSLRHKGIAQATLQDQIEQEYQQSLSGPAH